MTANLSVDNLTLRANEKAPTASRQWGHRPELDGIRGLAILLVLVGHSGLTHQGPAWVGLNLFFALSGYLITGVLLGNPERRTFYIRRAARLAPALGILVAVLVVAGNGWQWATTLLYVQNWSLVIGPDTVMTPLGHAWSLSVEEQFYLVWPWLLPLAVRRPWLLVAVAAASIWLRWIAPANPIPVYYYSTVTRLDALALGSLLAIVAPRRLPWGTLALVVLLAVAMLSPATDAQSILAASTLAAVALVWSAPRWLGVLAPLGRISYSLYLYHWPLSLWLGPIGLVLAVPLAWLSTRYIEEPIRQWVRSAEQAAGDRVGARDVARRADLRHAHGERA